METQDWRTVEDTPDGRICALFVEGKPTNRKAYFPKKEALEPCFYAWVEHFAQEGYHSEEAESLAYNSVRGGAICPSQLNPIDLPENPPKPELNPIAFEDIPF